MKRQARPERSHEGPERRSQPDRRCSSGEQRAVRALRTLSAGNRTLLRATDEAQLLQAMCQVIVEEGGYRVSSVGYAEHDESKVIRVKACAGMDPALLKALPLTWADTEMGQWAVATAIRTGQPSVGRHLLTEPSYASIRAYALRAGYAAASAFPLVVDGEVIGRSEERRVGKECRL